ncbi:MAG TPA: head GIN domain-containing protein [Xanthobacteraceae bacterium]|nr:head GIN domain-containing protein [Xanthobacteraceae bacterium]
MKKVVFIVLALVIGVGGLVAYKGYELFKSIAANAVRGSGKITTETRNVGSFTSVRISGVGSAVIERTGTPGLSISADDNLLPLITSDVKDGTLSLGFKSGTIISSASIEYRVTVGDLREVHVSGATGLRADDLAGSALAVTVSGAGRVRLSGRIDDLEVDVSGAGSLDAAALTARHVTVEASGAGNVSVNASDTLDAKASGAGTVRYVGAPKLTSHVSGAGSIREGRQ